MLKINQIKLPVGQNEQQLEKKIRKILNLPKTESFTYEIIKKSLDARKKPELFYVYTVHVTVHNESKVKKKIHPSSVSVVTESEYQFPVAGKENLSARPVIVGAGPAGLFAAYQLTEAGYLPLVLERGKKVQERQKDVEQFWQTGRLLPESNVQFGEGGAGTFSDGKLNSVVKDPTGRNRYVLRTFVKFGAPSEILYDNKPHIGTDILSKVIANMRTYLEAKGATFLFENQMTDLVIEKGRLKAIVTEKETIPTDVVILALGHSARDTFEMLEQKAIPMEAKNFAVGFRVEHPQKMIDQAMYGEWTGPKLPAAPYKVTSNFPNGRGVYSFCMCPGGYVVNASSEAGRLAVNGMSYSDRSGINSNSAIVVTVTPEDYGNTHPLAGMEFQREIEAKAYQEGKGKIPVQCFGDFCENRITKEFGQVMPQMKGMYRKANLRNILPEELNQQLIEGIHGFSRQITGFDQADAVLSGVESRTSSPVRIERDAAFQSVNLAGLYPCGEGAGYAGGITSAAMDGLRVFEAVASRYAPFGSR